MPRSVLVFSIALALVAAGCGQTGPLYLPDKPSAEDADTDEERDNEAGDGG